MTFITAMRNLDRKSVNEIFSGTSKVCSTVEQADKLRRVQSRPKGAVARVGSAKEENGAVVGQGGQGSSARSGDSKPRGSCGKCGKGGHRMADSTTKRKVGTPRRTAPGHCSTRWYLWTAVLF